MSTHTRARARERSTQIPLQFSIPQQVSVLFADLVGFTKVSSNMPPEDIVQLLTTIFTRYDSICVEEGVTKIKTLGDGFALSYALSCMS